MGAIVSGTSSSDTPPGPPAAGVPHASAPTAHRVRSVLAIPAFRRLWLVTAVSATGDWLSLLALSALATQLATGYQAQSFALGGVVATKLLPALVLGPLAGVLADKFDRRRVMVTCDLLRFALFLSIPLVGSLWWLLVATLLIEMCALFWIPAKDASVPNLLRRPDQIETANQLALVMTYGVAVITASGLFTVISGLGGFLPGSTPEISTAYVALVLNGLAYLLTATTVWFRIREISGRAAQRRAAAARAARAAARRFRFVASTPLVRGLVIGIIGAFTAGGIVVGSATLYAASLGGGNAAYGMLFIAVFVGLALGMGAAPRLSRRLPHNRLFGTAIVAAGCALVLVALAPHLTVAIAGVGLVGGFAGIAFLTGLTIIGAQVADEVRGRIVAFVQSIVRLTLLGSMALVPLIVGLVSARTVDLFGYPYRIDGTRVVMLAGGAIAAVVGMLAYRQMDDRRTEPLLPDLLAALRRGVRRGGSGMLIAVEGATPEETAEQSRRLVGALRERGHRVVLAGPAQLRAEPGAAVPALSGARAGALAEAAVRADLVERVVRPALNDGATVVADRFLASPLVRFGVVADRTQAELDGSELESLASFATGRLRPDVSVLLDRAPTSVPAEADVPAGDDTAPIPLPGEEHLQGPSAAHPHGRRRAAPLRRRRRGRHTGRRGRPGARRAHPGAAGVIPRRTPTPEATIPRGACDGPGVPQPRPARALRRRSPIRRRRGHHGGRLRQQDRHVRCGSRTRAVPAPQAAIMTGVWDEVVGQAAAVAELATAAEDPSAMTHAWLFTGPPGSGRSVAARAFAAALQCPAVAGVRGCGECPSCHTAMAGTHTDIREVVPEGLSIGVNEMRALVQLAAHQPAVGRYQIVIITDADRLTEGASNALLKAVEEPSDQTVFLLCAPSEHPDDVAATIRSRCRRVALRSPAAEAVATVLTVRDGVDPETAQWAASVCGGHIGRARHLARDAEARGRRERVLTVPLGLRGLGDAFGTAAELDRAAMAEADDLSGERDAVEREELGIAMGAGGVGKGVAAAARAGEGRGEGAGEAPEGAQHPQPPGRPGPGADRPRRVLPRCPRRRGRGAGGADQPGPRRRRPPRGPRVGARVGAAQAGGGAGLSRGARPQRETADRARGDAGRPAPGLTNVSNDWRPVPRVAPHHGRHSDLRRAGPHLRRCPADLREGRRRGRVRRAVRRQRRHPAPGRARRAPWRGRAVLEGVPRPVHLDQHVLLRRRRGWRPRGPRVDQRRAPSRTAARCSIAASPSSTSTATRSASCGRTTTPPSSSRPRRPRSAERFDGHTQAGSGTIGGMGSPSNPCPRSRIRRAAGPGCPGRLRRRVRSAPRSVRRRSPG